MNLPFIAIFELGLGLEQPPVGKYNVARKSAPRQRTLFKQHAVFSGTTGRNFSLATSWSAPTEGKVPPCNPARCH